ncbi:MAG: hypothetical protein FWB86_03420 [Treponema sp.]|nr:hypothetical protein [Treponema sp.]MCL2251207.1 hypothetical protein [Treponema sp.]
MQEKDRVSEETPASEEASASSETINNIDIIRNKTTLIIIAVCVAISIIFMKSGFLSMFYLAPLGYAALISGSMQITFAAIALVNIIVTIFINLFSGNNQFSLFEGNLLIEILYFSAIFFMFIWIAGGKRIRTAYRLILSSAAVSAAFFIFVWRNESFNSLLNDLSRSLSFFFNNELRNEALLNQETSQINAEAARESVLEMIKSISLRGGLFFSMLLMFFINYQLTYAFILLTKRFKIKAAEKFLTEKKQKFPLGIINFLAPANAIWFLSGSLATVLIARLYKIEIIEILAWNVFIICAIIFLTQGAGILMLYLERKSAVFRLIFGFLLFFTVLSPLSAAALVALILLGIAEIWLPIRALISKEEN